MYIEEESESLSPTFMQIINTHVEFIWQEIMMNDEDNIEVYEYEEKNV